MARSGIFRTPVPALPNAILRLFLPRKRLLSAIDRIWAKVGLDPESQPEPLDETDADSNVFAGTAQGLGTVRIEIWNLSREPDQAARIRLFVTSPELGLDQYLLELQEETPGSLAFHDRLCLRAGEPARRRLPR